MTDNKLAEALRDATLVAVRLDAICGAEGSVDRIRARDAAIRVRDALQAHAAEAAQPAAQADTMPTTDEIRRCANNVDFLDGGEHIDSMHDMLHRIADAIDAALKSQAEPVAYAAFTDDGLIRMWSKKWFGAIGKNPVDPTPLYTHPPAQPHPGATHCDNCGLTWLDDGLNPPHCPYCESAQEWQPIETAPRDTPVWVVLDDGAIIMAELVYDNEAEGWLWSRGIEPYITSDGEWHFTDGDLDDWRPVLWSPFPPPPAMAREASDAT